MNRLDQTINHSRVLALAGSASEHITGMNADVHQRRCRDPLQRDCRGL